MHEPVLRFGELTYLEIRSCAQQGCIALIPSALVGCNGQCNSRHIERDCKHLLVDRSMSLNRKAALNRVKKEVVNNFCFNF